MNGKIRLKVQRGLWKFYIKRGKKVSKCSFKRIVGKSKRKLMKIKHESPEKFAEEMMSLLQKFIQWKMEMKICKFEL